MYRSYSYEVFVNMFKLGRPEMNAIVLRKVVYNNVLRQVRRCSDGMHIIKMPSIMNEKEGKVSNWSKKVGESFVSGDRLCEIVFPIATIGIDAKSDGVLAKIVVGAYETSAAESTIALYATNRDYYMNYLAESMEDVQDSEKHALTVEAVEEATKKPDAGVMMKVVKHLIQSGSIEAKSEIAKHIQSLARKGDAELLAAFEASCEGASYHQETFDEEFFLSNATAIAEEHIKLEKK